MFPLSTVHFVGRGFKAYGQIRAIAQELNAGDLFHGSADEFFEFLDAEAAGCVVLECDDAAGSAPAFIRRMSDSGYFLPVIVLAADEAGCTESAVEAMKCGAADFLVKPIERQRLRGAVETSLERAAGVHSILRLREETAARYESLTTRERQVLERVVAGKPTKNIAHELGTSRNTVQNQRASILRKMQARSVVDIVRVTILMQLGDALIEGGFAWQDAEIDLFRSLASADADSSKSALPRWAFRADAA